MLKAKDGSSGQVIAVKKVKHSVDKAAVRLLVVALVFLFAPDLLQSLWPSATVLVKAVILRILEVIILVVVFRNPECRPWKDGGRNLIHAPSLELQNLRQDFLDNLPFLVRLVKDDLVIVIMNNYQ